MLTAGASMIPRVDLRLVFLAETKRESRFDWPSLAQKIRIFDTYDIQSESRVGRVSYYAVGRLWRGARLSSLLSVSARRDGRHNHQPRAGRGRAPRARDGASQETRRERGGGRPRG
jgi:hypothetical protein